MKLSLSQAKPIKDLQLPTASYFLQKFFYRSFSTFIHIPSVTKAHLPIRLILADDHKIVLDGLRLLIESQPDIEIVATASTGSELLEKISLTKPDLLLLDITLGDDDGIELCRQLKYKYPSLAIIALTMYNSGSYLQSMIANGAAGYVLKDADIEELLEAIHTVYRGGTHYSKRPTEKLLSEIAKPFSGDRKRKQEIKISQREKEILKLIALEFTTSEIAGKLFISINTVETHRANLMMKMDCKNVAGLVRVAYENHLLD
jgi:DNA-binding NarL/FixJ family response regulator